MKMTYFTFSHLINAGSNIESASAIVASEIECEIPSIIIETGSKSSGSKIFESEL